HSGIALWIGEDSTKLLTPIPLDQIVGVLEDEDNTGEIYAYKRQWSRRMPNGKLKDMVRWYFVDTYKHLQTETITVGAEREIVEQGWTAFDMHANAIEGWTFGVPDAPAAHVWAEIAKG